MAYLSSAKDNPAIFHTRNDDEFAPHRASPPMSHSHHDKTELSQSHVITIIHTERGIHVLEKRAGYTEEIIGYFLFGSKSAGFHIIPYISVKPSAAFTVKRSGALHPNSFKRRVSGFANSMIIFPWLFLKTIFGSISTVNKYPRNNV